MTSDPRVITKPDPRNVCVVGDTHGHSQLALSMTAMWQRQLGVKFDGIFLVGDVATFPTLDSLDKATRRHSVRNPSNVEFTVQWMATPPEAHLRKIFTPVEDGGLGIECPVVMVHGNHEGFEHLVEIESQ